MGLALPALPDGWVPLHVETPTRFGGVVLDAEPGRIDWTRSPGVTPPERVVVHVPAGAWRVNGHEVVGPALDQS